MKYSPSGGKGNRVERGCGSVNTLSCHEMESFDGIANETGRHRRPIVSELAENLQKCSSLQLSLLLFFFFLFCQLIASIQPRMTKRQYLASVFISRSLPERCPIDPLVSTDYTSSLENFHGKIELAIQRVTRVSSRSKS